MQTLVSSNKHYLMYTKKKGIFTTVQNHLAVKSWIQCQTEVASKPRVTGSDSQLSPFLGPGIKQALRVPGEGEYALTLVGHSLEEERLGTNHLRWRGQDKTQVQDHWLGSPSLLCGVRSQGQFCSLREGMSHSDPTSWQSWGNSLPSLPEKERCTLFLLSRVRIPSRSKSTLPSTHQ